MTRMAFIPWLIQVGHILGWSQHQFEQADGEAARPMWEAGLTPVEAAAAITVAEFERSLQ